jgi:TRAP-type C4-dicarboxylate transport system permease small subunit
MVTTMVREERRGVIRTALDRVYLASGVLAGVFLAGIAVTIIAQIVGRFVGLAVDSTELAGFCMAASTFLGLAYTLKNGTHVRVTLALGLLPAGVRRAVEMVACVIGLAAAAYFTYFSVLLVMQSYDFGDTSPGLIAAPFWIPQLGMAVGAGLLTIAFADELVILLSGGTPGYEAQEGVLEHLPVESAHAPEPAREAVRVAEKG